MWQSTHQKTFPFLNKESIWQLWSDVANWHRWDKDIEYARPAGPFATGTQFELKPKGGPKVALNFVSVEPLRGYTDLCKFPLAKMYGIHEMQETQQGLRLTITIRVEGPLAWLWKKVVAEKVAAEAPAQMDALAQYACRPN